MEKSRKPLTYANVMSTLAVFLVLGGGIAWAATQLPKNSVGATQLKKNAVTGAKVKNRSLAAVDFKAGELPAGQRGETGPPGPRGLTDLHEVIAKKTIVPNEKGFIEVQCPPGQVATGGGFADGGQSDAYAYQSDPVMEPVKGSTTPVGWEVSYQAGATELTAAYAFALCATP